MIERSWYRALLAFLIAITLHLVLLSFIRPPSIPEPQLRLRVTVRTRAPARTTGETSREHADETLAEGTTRTPPEPTGSATITPESTHRITEPEETRLIKGESTQPSARSEGETLQPTRVAPATDAPPGTGTEEARAATRSASSQTAVAMFTEIPTRRAPPPVYPEHARRNGRQGTVELELSIDARGGVTSIEIVSSSGYPLLDEAAISAVTRWKFERGEDGRRTRRRFVFRLESQ